MSGFQAPSFDLPLPLAEYLAMIPKAASTRGFFHQMLIDEVSAKTSARISTTPYAKLKMYPMSELNQLYADAARLLHPELPMRAGIRLLARKAYTAYVQNSSLLKVLSSAIGKNPGGIFSSMSKVSSFAISGGSITAKEIGASHAIVQFKEYWLLDCISIGNFEGLMESVTGGIGRISIQNYSECDYDIKAEWG